MTIAKLEKKYSNHIKAKIKGRLSTFLSDDETNKTEMDGDTTRTNSNNNHHTGTCNDESYPVGGGDVVDVSIDDDIDGICSFQDAFKHSVVFFMLRNNDLILDQLGRFDSIVNTLQRCLSQGASENISSSNKSDENDRGNVDNDGSTENAKKVRRIRGYRKLVMIKTKEDSRYELYC